MSKEKLEYLMEVRGRVKSTRLSPSNLLIMKLGSADPEKFNVFTIEDLIEAD